MKANTCLISVAVAVALAGCATHSEYVPPDLGQELPEGWRTAPASAAPEVSPAELARWWDHFSNPQLTALVEQALEDNRSLAVARERIAEAQAQRGIVNSAREPQVSAQAAYTRTKKEERSIGIPLVGAMETGGDLFAVSAPAHWELDFWGKVAAQVEAANAAIAASVEDYRDAAVTLAAETALAYVDARTLEAREALLEENIALQEKTRALVASRLHAGTGTALEMEQITRLIAQTRSRLPEVRGARTMAENRLAVLLGQPPADGLIAPGAPPQLPAEVAMGTPAQVLTRRADIRAAERRYAATVNLVTAAKAERYPTLVLDGALTFRSDEIAGLFDNALTYSMGPMLRVPLFTGKRIESQIAQEESKSAQARILLEQTLLQALAEVENAATGAARAREQMASLATAAQSARNGITLAQQLYDAGLGTLLQVLDAQRDLVSLEDAQCLARQAALGQTIQLYRALGGGWEAIGLDGSTRPAGQEDETL